ncbi:flavodoxin [Actinomycetospora sp. NBRC 106375]|uniref:flavodoxin family protein n=1 Tax=Actinomycetospora sp. NBRC 106375 TaxID=3032207 RepID=UPI00249FCACB|nr:NAD(P)H-dependent oxidoreductase [Actinomycetospora sp. NBRC 106375]GLZ49524.1 flavodoxin [Actinomycetospora sp. NBRC 106375]
MTRLLVVHHTPSPSLHELLTAVLEGAGTDEIEADVEVVARPALTAGAADALDCDAVVLGTPANIGTMSGALKHFFDQVYYPCLDQTAGRPFGLYVHGGSDTAGAVRDILRITGALGWEQVAEVCESTGEIGTAEREAAWELGATVALQAAERTGTSRA